VPLMLEERSGFRTIPEMANTDDLRAVYEALKLRAKEEPDPVCGNCGERATFSHKSGEFTETHGLDCGPYEHWHEEWLACDKCGAETDEKEIARMARALIKRATHLLHRVCPNITG
jgi:hypothetical protein